MNFWTLVTFLGVCAMATAQLSGPLIGSGSRSGNVGGTGLGGMGGMGGGSSGMAPNPMMMMLPIMTADPSGMSYPVMSMLMRNPNMMQNPMGAFMMSSMLGVDVNKIATPMAMMNGMGGGSGSLMRWLPLMMGDPNMFSLMLSMGMGGGMGMGGMSMPMTMMAAANA